MLCGAKEKSFMTGAVAKLFITKLRFIYTFYICPKINDCLQDYYYVRVFRRSIPTNRATFSM